MKIFKSLSIEESWTQAVASRNLAQITNLGLIIICLLLTFKVFFQKPHTIAIPPNFIQPITMVGDDASSEYAVGWSLFTAQILGNVNPRNIEFVQKIIKSMLSPSLLNSVANSMDRTTEIMRARKVDQTFIVQDAKHDPRTGIVYVWGKKVTQAMRQEPIVGKWTYEIKIVSKQGMPRITYLKQYSGVPSNADLKGNTTKSVPDYLSDDIKTAIDEKAAEVSALINEPGHKPDIAPEK